jgi:ABC-type molybdate transport system substrate-binding protein
MFLEAISKIQRHCACPPFGGRILAAARVKGVSVAVSNPKTTDLGEIATAVLTLMLPRLPRKDG